MPSAQDRAIVEIGADLAGAHPMHRLLQGDVGAGKTVVAVAALLTAVEGGHRGALHGSHRSPRRAARRRRQRDAADGLTLPSDQTLLADRPLRVALLTNPSAGSGPCRLAGPADGTVDVLIGTHALLTESVAFHSLGVVVIDEQHRSASSSGPLSGKNTGRSCGVLVMTATPIPRTTTMTVYGDLDTTVLDELPPGGPHLDPVGPRPARRGRAWERVLADVAAGRQAYVVCPLIEESERVQARSAGEERDRLAAGELAASVSGCSHGQLSAKERTR